MHHQPAIDPATGAVYIAVALAVVAVIVAVTNLQARREARRDAHAARAVDLATARAHVTALTSDELDRVLLGITLADADRG